MRMVVVVLVTWLAIGCAPPRQQIKRWPGHREQSEARFIELEGKTAELERRLHELEAALARTKRPEPAPPVVAPPAP